MELEEKDRDLLLRDLCARLAYGVKIQVPYDICSGYYTETVWTIDNDKPFYVNGRGIEYIKPYLFPLSSLTEEQRNNICELLLDTQKKFSPYGEINTKGCDNLFISSVKQSNALINYCLTNHLDINGLIEEGLAIDATGLNIYC